MAGAEYDRVLESQGQALTEDYAHGGLRTGDWELDADARQVVWRMPEQTLRDRTFGASGVYVLDGGQRFGAAYEHTPAATFTYHDLYELSYEADFAEGDYAGALAELRRFTGVDAWLYSGYAGRYFGECHARVQAYASGGDLSGLIRLERVEGFFQPGVWLAGGRGETQRPYLAPTTNASFASAGAKLGFYYAGFHPYVYYEYESEKVYWQQTLAAGLEWSQ